MADLSTNQSRAHQLAQRGPVLVADGDRLVSQAVEKVTESTALVMRDVLSQLPSLADNYHQTFDPSDIGLYCAGLCSHFDETLSAELDRRNKAALTGMYEAVQKQLIGQCEIQ